MRMVIISYGNENRSHPVNFGIFLNSDRIWHIRNHLYARAARCASGKSSANSFMCAGRLQCSVNAKILRVCYGLGSRVEIQS